MATDFDPEAIVQQTTDTVAKKYPKHDRASIEALVRAQVDELKDRPIRDYVGVLAERAVKQKLKSEK